MSDVDARTEDDDETAQRFRACDAIALSWSDGKREVVDGERFRKR